MLSIKGIFRNGVAQPLDTVAERDGEPVIITFLGTAQTATTSASGGDAWNQLSSLIASCAADTGVADLAHQHDHYLHGKPKYE